MQADLLDVLTRLASASNIRCMRVTPPLMGWTSLITACAKRWTPILTGRNSAACCAKHPANTLLFAEGTFELQFALFRIPDEENAVFMIGPWATAERSRKIPQLGTPSHW